MVMSGLVSRRTIFLVIALGHTSIQSFAVAQSASCASESHLELLRSENHAEREGAAYQLGSLCNSRCSSATDAGCKEVVPLLEMALSEVYEGNSPSFDPSHNLIWALGKCGVCNSKIPAGLFELLHNPSSGPARPELRRSIAITMLSLWEKSGQSRSGLVGEFIEAFARNPERLHEIPTILALSLRIRLSRQLREKSKVVGDAGMVVAMIGGRHFEAENSDELLEAVREEIVETLNSFLSNTNLVEKVDGTVHSYADSMLAFLLRSDEDMLTELAKTTPARAALMAASAHRLQQFDKAASRNDKVEAGQNPLASNKTAYLRGLAQKEAILLKRLVREEVEFLGSLAQEEKTARERWDGGERGSDVEPKILARPESRTRESALLALLSYATKAGDEALLKETETLILAEPGRERIVLTATQSALSVGAARTLGNLLKWEGVRWSGLQAIVDGLGSNQRGFVLQKVLLENVTHFTPLSQNEAGSTSLNFVSQHYDLLEALIEILRSGSLEDRKSSLNLMEKLYVEWKAPDPILTSGIDAYFLTALIIALDDRRNLSLRKEALKLGRVIRSSSSHQLQPDQRWLLQDSLSDLETALENEANGEAAGTDHTEKDEYQEIQRWLTILRSEQSPKSASPENRNP